MPPRSGASALNTPVQSPALNSSAASAKDTRQFSNSDHEPRLRIRPTLRTRRPLISMTEQIRFEQVMDSLSELTERAHEAQAAHSHLIERSQNLQGTYAKQQAAIDRLNRVHETITAEHLHLRGQVATILEKLERLTETLTRPQREAKKRKHQRRLCESSGNFRRKTSSQRQCRAKK